MKNNVWSAAFTIIVDGLQIDLAELPPDLRKQIAACILEGRTDGTLQEVARSMRPA